MITLHKASARGQVPALELPKDYRIFINIPEAFWENCYKQKIQEPQALKSDLFGYLCTQILLHTQTSAPAVAGGR